MSIRQVSNSNSASKQKIRKIHRYKFTNLSLSYQVRKKLYQMLISFDDNINYQFQKQQIKSALIQILQQTQTQVSYVINNVYRYDLNHDGIVTYQQFSNFCLEQHFGEMAIQRLHKKKIYARGHQRIMNYQEFSKTLNYCLSFISIVPKEDIVRSIFTDVDRDNNGYISYSEYFTFLKEYFGSQSQSATIVTVNTVQNDLKKIYGNVDRKKIKQDIFKEKKQKLQKQEEERKQKEIYQAQQRLRRPNVTNSLKKLQPYKPQTTKLSSEKKLESTNNIGKQSTKNFQPFKLPFSSSQNLSSSQATPSNIGRNLQQIKPSFQSTQKLQQTNKTSLQPTRNSQFIKPSFSTQNLSSANSQNLTTQGNNLQQVKLDSQTANNTYKSPSYKQKTLNELKTISQKISKLIYQQLKLTILQQDKKMQLNSTPQSTKQFLTKILKIPNIKVNQIIKQIFKDQSTISYQQLLKYTLQNYECQNLIQKNRYPLNKQQFINSNLNNLQFIKIKPYRFLFEELFEKYTSQKKNVEINKQEYQQLMNIIFKNYNWPRLTGQLRKKEPIYIL